MPADIGQPLAEGDGVVDRRALVEMLHVMEARAAQAGGVQPLELGVADVGLHQRDAFVGLAGGGNGVLGDAIVVAVAVRLHDHAMLDAEPGMQRKQHFLGGVGRRVVAPVGEGKARARPEHMHMRIAGARAAVSVSACDGCAIQ